jgi:hypothetical protein
MKRYFFKVEYDQDYTGGNYSGVGDFAMVPVGLAILVGVNQAFKEITGEDPIHIVHFNTDEWYDEDGKLLEE